MANIALLNRCNLRCPYCFADEYIEDEKSDITRASFEHLLDFAAPDGEIGIIGGEPLLHKEFDTLLKIALDDFRINKITVFTNGIFIDKFVDLLSHPRIITLVNLNSDRDIGAGNFERAYKNVGTLISRGGRVTLGVNVYEVGQDFSCILQAVREYRLDKVRLSVVIPKDKSKGGIPYFLEMKETLLGLYRELKELGACPCYDCNAIPECVYTEEEKSFLSTLPYANDFERQIFMGQRSVCSPVIDLYPDETATRCFGCYGMGRVKISDFDNIFDLRNYFFKEIDARLVHPFASEKCEKCYKYKTFACFGGCLCYKEK